MWSKGVVRVNGRNFFYCVKHFEEPSGEYGINGGGKISKMEIREDNEAVMLRYDRGWDIEPKDADTLAVYKLLLKNYN